MATTSNLCVCPETEAKNDRQLSVTGNVYFIFVFNMKKFVITEDKQKFEQYRGSDIFFRSVNNIKFSKADLFSEDMIESRIVKEDPGASIFRGHLKNEWFTSSYHAKQIYEDQSTNGQSYDCRIRVSRLGLFEVRLALKIMRNKTVHTNTSLDLFSRLAEIVDNTHNYGYRWAIALNCVNELIDAIGGSIELVDVNSIGPEKIHLSRLEKTAFYYPPYIVFLFDKIECTQCDQRITIDALLKNYHDLIAAILEGVLIDKGDSQWEKPEIDAKSLNRMTDFGTWDDEVCFFTPERCLIYFQPRDIVFQDLQYQNKTVPYRDYWACILRGIEHSVAVRSALYIIESNTTEELEFIPDLTQKYTDDEISEGDRSKIFRTARKVAENFNMLPKLRDISVSTSAFRPSFAVDKFTYLNNECFHFPELLHHIEQNVSKHSF